MPKKKNVGIPYFSPVSLDLAVKVESSPNGKACVVEESGKTMSPQGECGTFLKLDHFRFFGFSVGLSFGKVSQVKQLFRQEGTLGINDEDKKQPRK